MDALILTCGTGGGHNSASAAMREELFSRGHSAEVLNPYLLRGDKTANVVDNAYISLVQKMPNAFGFVYKLGDAYRRLPLSSPVYHLNRVMVPLMEDYLRRHSFDAIICTHLFPGEIIASMKRRGLPLPPVYFIATDYTCIPFTEETDCDRYIIPLEQLTQEFCECGVDREKIFPLGIPVREQFKNLPDRETAREILGLEKDARYILIAGGSIGAGQLEPIVGLLSEHYGDTVKLIVVCGSNDALYQSLSSTWGEKCVLLRFTGRFALYIRACDLFLTKPGGLSSTEAAVAGTALIHLNPIPGCETKNMAFFAQNGLSCAVNYPKTELAAACDSLLIESNREKMVKNQRKMIASDAAEKICRLIESEEKRMCSVG